jgi:SAM-dependent methyltransferase
MTANVKEITSCEVCGSVNLTSALNLGGHPLCDDLISVGESRSCRIYPIEILFCDICKTAHQKYQVPKHVLFPSSYHYRSRFTEDVKHGMADLVSRVCDRYGDLSNKLVLDIGCNDGTLLSFFRERGLRTLGVEPSDAASDAASDGHSVKQKFFTLDLAKEIRREYGSVDFVVFTNVFAHIENLDELIRALVEVGSSETKFIIENHYLGAVLAGGQFDTFYHEHPRTYSLTSFNYIAERLGCKLTHFEFPRRYGGNIRVFMEKTETAECERIKTNAVQASEIHFQDQLMSMSQKIFRWKIQKRKEIDELAQRHGPLIAKAFPGRAAILVQLLDLSEKQVKCVCEKPGSAKIGHYVPGTRIPIVSDSDINYKTLSSPVLNLAWHIGSEIDSYLNDLGFAGRVIPVLDARDFNEEK